MPTRADKIDQWIQAGGWILAGSERAARSLRQAYNERRIAEGATVWREARILEWKGFLNECQRRMPIGDGRMQLNSLQEESLWDKVLAASADVPAVLLPGPRKKLARMAGEAHALLANYAEEFLAEEKRSTWAPEFAVFSDWLARFESECETLGALSAHRTACNIALQLQNAEDADPAPHAPLLLVGFDRLMPVQRKVLDAWGEWQQDLPTAIAPHRTLYAAPDRECELTACARWCAEGLREKNWQRILVVTPSNPEERGKVERIFRRWLSEDFEFSLGRTLAEIGPVRGALLMLRWLGAELSEAEVDWLGASGQAGNRRESRAITQAMRKLRTKHREQRDWSLKELIEASKLPCPLIDHWVDRMQSAHEIWLTLSSQQLSPLAWGEALRSLIAQMSLHLARPQSSVEYQAAKQFEELLESCATLGFDERQLSWWEYLALLGEQATEALFALQSEAAPVLIAGPAESAGLEADAIWFLGTSEEGWPRSAEAHPLLPIDVQRNSGMPHSSAKIDWHQAEAVTARLLAAAPVFVASYARVTEDGEAKPSRLLTRYCGNPISLPDSYRDNRNALASLDELYDTGEVPLEDVEVSGGAGLISAQSQCPFKAFVHGRLHADDWQRAEEGLTAAMRGELVHDILYSIWSDEDIGIKSHAELCAIGERAEFVAKHVALVMAKLPEVVHLRMPSRYLEIEQKRLVQLVTTWLDYEAARIPFHVKGCEVKRNIELEGLHLRLRLDRLDETINGNVLVLDYKSGKVTPKQWEAPRPQNLQLPLYACKALNADEPLEGLSFAQVRTGEVTFAGLFRNAKVTLREDLTKSSNLIKKPLTDNHLAEWKDILAQLARDYRAGLATVDPIDRRLNCGQCRYQTLCRIEENSALSEEDTDEIDREDEEIPNA